MTTPGGGVRPARRAGRYTLFDAIGVGGHASIHVGRLEAPLGFARTVAIKRLRGPVGDRAGLDLLVDEARLAGRIQHPNVVQTLDVVLDGGELLLVLEFVLGQSLAELRRLCDARRARIPVPIAAAIAVGALRGAHAAHEAKDEHGVPLDIVHRDLSPQNVMVDVAGVARVLDFGIAKARGRMQVTKTGQLKGTLSYVAPEQIHGDATRRSDIFALGVVLWEMLTGRRLFEGESDGAVLAAILSARVPAPSTLNPEVPDALDAVVLRSCRRAPDERFATGLEMARAIETQVEVAPPSTVATWLRQIAGSVLAERERLVEVAETARVSERPALASARDVVAAVLATDPVEGMSVSPPGVPERAEPAVRSAPRRRAAIAGGVVALVLFVGIAFAVRPTKREPAAAPPRSEAPPPPIETSPPPAPPESAPLPISPTPAGPRGRPTRSPRARPSARPECDPPYVLDANGRVVYKRACF